MSGTDTRIQINAQGDQAIEVLRKIGQNIQDTEKQTKTATQSMSLSWAGFSTGLNQAWEVANKVQRSLKTLYEFTKEGAAFVEAKANFSAYAASYAKSSDAILEATRKATKNQVSDFELVKRTHQAMRQGVTQDTAELARLWEIADTKSDEFGGSIADNFSRIAEAIAKGNGRALVELGLLPESMGRASNSADLLAKRGSILKDVLSQFGDDAERLASVGETAADNFNQLEAAFANLKAQTAENLLPAFKDIAEFLKTDLIPTATWAINSLREVSQFAGQMTVKNFQGPQNLAAAKVHIEELERELHAMRSDPNRIASDLAKLGNSGRNQAIRDAEEQLASVRLMLPSLNKEDLNKKKSEELDFINSLASAAQDGIKKVEQAQTTAKKATKAHREEVDHLGKRLQELALETSEGFAEAMGGKVIDPLKLAEKVMLSATRAAGGFAQALKNGATDAGQFEKLATSARDKAQAVLMQATVGAVGGGKQERTWISEEEAEYKRKAEEAKRAQEAAQEDFKNKLRINVASAFEEGIYDAIKSGNIEDFGKAIANSLRSQLASALSTAITGSIFGVGNGAGSFNMGSMLFGGSGGGMQVGVNPLNFMTGGMSVSGGGSSGGGIASQGLLGGVMKGIGPLWKGGALQFGNLTQLLGTGAAVGFAVNRLFGTGGLFSGSRVIHGQEQIQLSGDVNTQVGQASKQRDELINGLVGVSASTLQALKDMQFAYSYTVKHKSGDGIFSKKTTTYEAVGVAEAQASINKYLELSQKATAEAAAREFEIAIKQMSAPLEALNMTISDLQAAIKGATGEQLTALNQQLRQAQVQKEQALNQYSANWFGIRMGTAAASAGSIWAPSMESGTGATPYGIRANMRYGEPNHITQLGLMQAQGMKDFNLGRLGIMAGSGDAQTAAYLQARKDYIGEAMATYQALMKDAEKRAREAKENTDAAARAIQEYGQAQQAYYAANLEQLQIEQELALAKKAKQDRLRDDILGTMLTHVAEVSEIGGKQVIVLAAGQPDARDLAVQIRDSLAGESPELAEALGQFIDSRGPRWN